MNEQNEKQNIEVENENQPQIPEKRNLNVAIPAELLERIQIEKIKTRTPIAEVVTKRLLQSYKEEKVA